MQFPFPDDPLSNQALQDLFQQDLAQIIDEEELSTDQAFLRICIQYLGFDTDIGIISDGKGDYGVDFIEVSTSGASIIQSKSAEFDNKVDFNHTMGPPHITDLPRIRSLFENLDGLPPKMNAQVKRALLDIKHNLRSSSATKKADPFHVSVYFCAQAADLTESAKAEFERLDTSPIAYGDIEIRITYVPVLLEDLLDAKWCQSNTKWLNKNHQRRERFDFDICGTLIRDSSKSCVFFTRASQLVNAYNEIGYQIFEANVRCEIKNSSVNKAIKNSIRLRRGRDEFKHLNNGITIICDSFQVIGGKTNPTGLRITHPGIINGLQTIKTLADSVSELSKDDYSHFEKECQILTRVHTQNSVNDYRDLVKSTNNQNPMKPRNLRSNDAEQVLLERYFSERLGWFYERKEGAWNAFKADHARWSTINQRPKHFSNGRIIKKVDNEDIAQAWLAVIGFSEQAVDQKRFLFSGERSFYDLIFLNRTSNHGQHYDHRIGDHKLLEDGDTQTPTGEGMLVAYLVREFAKTVVRTRKENREEAVTRRNIDQLDRAKQEAQLAQDTEYLKGLALRAMLLLFVEFFGYVMFSTFGKNVHNRFASLLKNGTLADIAKDGDLSIARGRVYDQVYSKDDILIHIWELYNHCVSQMIATAWLRERQQAPNISKFTYSEKTREPLYKELGEVNKIIKEQLLIRKWTVPLNEAGSVEQYVRSVLER